MSRPTVAPDFATDANFPAGSDNWSGQPNKVDPAGLIATGFIPTAMLKAEILNYLHNNHGEWIKYLDSDSIFPVWAQDDEDFQAMPTTTITASLTALPSGKSFYVESSGNGKITVGGNTGTEADGLVFMMAADGAAVSYYIVGGGQLIKTTDDFKMLARAYVVDRANLDTMANKGLIVSAGERSIWGPGFVAGNDVAYWKILKPDFSVVEPTVQVNVATDWQYLRIERVSGTIKWYVDGTEIYSLANAQAIVLQRTLVLKGLGVAVDHVYVEVDYQRIRVFRPWS